jgi:hypothetical protein
MVRRRERACCSPQWQPGPSSLPIPARRDAKVCQTLDWIGSWSGYLRLVDDCAACQASVSHSSAIFNQRALSISSLDVPALWRHSSADCRYCAARSFGISISRMDVICSGDNFPPHWQPLANTNYGLTIVVPQTGLCPTVEVTHLLRGGFEHSQDDLPRSHRLLGVPKHVQGACLKRVPRLNTRMPL